MRFGCVGHASLEILIEAIPVRIVPDPLSVPKHDRVHRSEHLGVLGQAGKMRDDRLLARMRDVASCEATVLKFCEQPGQRRSG